MSAKRRAMMRSVRMQLQQAHAAAAGRLMSDARDWHSGGPLLSNLHGTFVHQGAYYSTACFLGYRAGLAHHQAVQMSMPPLIDARLFVANCGLQSVPEMITKPTQASPSSGLHTAATAVVKP
jgi:hypothetical protein